MDKYEFRIKAEQLERLVERKDYKTAVKIADGIDWRRVRNVELLTKAGEVYEHLGRYEDSYELLNMAYDRAPIGRSIVYKMAEIATRMGDYEEAIELYKEFVKVAPHDLSRYALKYKIYQAKGAPLTDQIAILEEYKSREYDEKWAYELAVLYYKEGMGAKCVEECDDLVLWFSEGEYVRRALELKMRIQPLTASQEEKYHNLMRMSVMDTAPEEEPAEEQETEQEWNPEDRKNDEIKIRTEDKDERFNTVNLQAEVAAGLKDLFEEAEAPVKKVRQTPDKKPMVASPDMGMKTVEPIKAATTFREVNSLRLGQREDGQLTFNDDENVLERQITGQLTIDEIMAEWRAKQQRIEADIAQAAREKEEAQKAERTAEERTEQEIKEPVPDIMEILLSKEELPMEEAKEELPAEETKEELSAGETAEELLTEEVVEELFLEEAMDELLAKEALTESQKSVEEAKHEPEAAEAEAEAEPETAEAEAEAEPETAEAEAEPETVEAEEEQTEAPEEELQEFPTIESEVEDDLPKEVDEIEAILLAALDEEEAEAQERSKEKMRQRAAKEKPEKEASAKPYSKKEEPASNMIQDLERMLINELKNVSGQHLTDEQEQLFAYFTAVHGMNQQLSEFLEEDAKRIKDGTSVTGNLVVTGESGTGKTTLAMDLVKAVQKQRQMKGSKMAKVTGEALSQKDVGEVVRKLSGGALIIEHAGAMTTEAASKLSAALLGQTDNLFVILEDEPGEIQRLFARSESLAAKFQKTIEIPVFTNNELVAFGKSYADEQGYVLDEMAVLALYNRIGNNQTSDHLVNVAEVKEMIDEAIERATKKGLAKIFAKRRQDEFGNYVLLEKDFEE